MIACGFPKWICRSGMVHWEDFGTSAIIMMSLLLSFLLVSQAYALSFESDPAAPRERYPMLILQAEGVHADDARDDLVVHDRRGRDIIPSLLADLTAFSVQPVDGVYVARFEIASPLPSDPGVPVNFFVYLDSDGDERNNAPATMSGPGSDAVVMLLFGTRTKWHSQWWQYDSVRKEWNRQEDAPPFTASGSVYTLALPSTLPLFPGKTMLRGFALTSDNAGSIAQDVVPGEGLPPLMQQPAQQDTGAVRYPIRTAAAGALLLSAGSIILWYSLLRLRR
ncbi:MAG: hypothetical protein PHO92_04590 [Candidatus Peribacteraceae bacterium]|nr:hypothetical protein [Candidatus Peribacteraceae bacterium]